MHTVYKSYPFTFLEIYQLDRLTGWLDKLTSVDLSGFAKQAKDLKSLDEWIDAIKAQTPLTLVFSSAAA